jgi:DNA-binding XRE family transcriptional regulator
MDNVITGDTCRRSLYVHRRSWHRAVRDELLNVRRVLRLTQAQLGEEIGAASKAVVYQWEAEKRRPSPVFWKKIEALRASRWDRNVRLKLTPTSH